MMGLLRNKTAIVYGAAGPVGAAVAGAFAREGARVVVSGRHDDQGQKLATELRNLGTDGARHAWRNKGSKPVTMLFFLNGARARKTSQA